MLNKNIDLKFCDWLCFLVIGKSKYAVGLTYDYKKMEAPKIIFKRKNNNEIISYCERKGIPIIIYDELAEILFNDYKIGEEIKEDLYITVCKLIRNIFYTKHLVVDQGL